MDETPAPDRPDRDGRLDRDGRNARLAAALRALDAQADREEAVAPDPARVAGHLIGVGDEDVLRDAAAHPATRRLLSDVVAVAGAAEADVETSRRDLGTSARSAALLARAMAAFDATASESRGSRSSVGDVADGAPERSLRILGAPREATSVLRRARVRAWRVAATVLVLLVPIGVLSFVNGHAEAGPVVALEGLERVGSDGAVATEGPRRLGVGATVTGLPGERLALRMAGGSRLVLPGEDVVRVACGDARCGRALFALDRGEVVLAIAGDGGAVEPVGLRLPRGERFDLLAGAARVSREAGDRIVVVLRDDAVARWTPPEGIARDLRGAGTLVLEGAAGPVSQAEPHGETDAGAQASFRDLEFFGGARRDPSPERRVGARRWRILSDGPRPPEARAPEPSSVRRSDGSGVPAIRMDLPVAGRARIAWQPDESALLSRRVIVHVRAASPVGAPSSAAPGEAPTPAPGRLRVELEGVPGAAAEVELAAGSETRALALELRLPEGWAADRPADAELVLALGGGARAATVWFECAGFDASESPSPARPAASPEDAKPRRGE